LVRHKKRAPKRPFRQCGILDASRDDQIFVLVTLASAQGSRGAGNKGTDQQRQRADQSRRGGGLAGVVCGLLGRNLSVVDPLQDGVDTTMPAI
jgi:hypothetical protein